MAKHVCKKIYRYGLCHNCFNKRLFQWDSSGRKVPFEQFIYGKKDVKRRRTERQRAIDRADRWFSYYIRIKYGLRSGTEVYCKCYTCGRTHHAKDIDCGHYIGRSNFSVRYNEHNARPQCKRCNMYRSGEHFKFELLLKDEIGQRKLDEMKRLATKVVKYTVFDLNAIADDYKEKTKEMLRLKGVRKWW